MSHSLISFAPWNYFMNELKTVVNLKQEIAKYPQVLAEFDLFWFKKQKRQITFPFWASQFKLQRFELLISAARRTDNVEVLALLCLKNLRSSRVQ